MKRWLLGVALVLAACGTWTGVSSAARNVVGYAPVNAVTVPSAKPIFTIKTARIDPRDTIEILLSPDPTIEQAGSLPASWVSLRARATPRSSTTFVATETGQLPPGRWYWQWMYADTSCTAPGSEASAQPSLKAVNASLCRSSAGTHCDAGSHECLGPILSFVVEPGTSAVPALDGSGSTGSPLTFVTGLPGGDVVEPSILYDARAPFFADPSGDNGYQYVMCLGAYYQSDATDENPNLWVSHDGSTWTYVVFANGIGTPSPGYTGPLTPIVPNRSQGDGNLSDPDLVRGPDGTYFILYNQFLTPTAAGGTGSAGADWSIKGISSRSLAGPWTAPVTLAATARASVRPASPSALWDGSAWQVYGVDDHDTSNTSVYHYTITGPNLLAGWTPRPPLAISLPPGYSSQVWWHSNAYRVGNTQYILMQDSTAGKSAGGNLWLISSIDGGTTWTVPSHPTLSGNTFYRSALVPEYRNGVFGIDLFYGELGSNWTIGRGYVALEPSP